MLKFPDMSTNTPSKEASVKISDDDRFHFDTQGFLVLRDVLSKAEVNALVEKFNEIDARGLDTTYLEKKTMHPNDVGKSSVIHIDDHYVRLNGLDELDPLFGTLVYHPRILPYLQEFMKEPKYRGSWGIANSQGPHFSSWHSGHEPCEYNFSNGIIRSPSVNTGWFLSRNGPDDGCLLLVPGSHKANLNLKFKSYPGIELPGSVRAVGEAGDVVLFSECVLHMGDKKSTPGPRTNLYFVYSEASRSD